MEITIKIPKINPWLIISLILAIALVVVVFQQQKPKITGAFILSKEEVGKKVIDYINNNLVPPGTNATLVKVEDMGTFYEILTSYQGQQIPVYATKDGKYMFLQSFNLSEKIERPTQQAQQVQQQEIPKRDRPEVELYIFSYCPYGVSALDSLVKVRELLKNYAGFKVKFFSHMHGLHEKQQNMIQECIQALSPDKYWEYAKQFREKVYQKCRNVECDKNESIALMESVGINSKEIMNCVEKDGEKYYQQDIKDANNLGLSGSPSFVINGVYVRNIDRSPEGIKSVVCSSFVTPPKECSQTEL